MSDIEIADILAETREFLETNGWGQGEFQVKAYDDENDDYEYLGYCAMGGVIYSQDIEEEECATNPLALAVANLLSTVLGLNEHRLTCDSVTGVNDGECNCVLDRVTLWNDADGRTQQEVLDAFAKAEKIARAGFDPDA